jgi:hypothetical protein
LEVILCQNFCWQVARLAARLDPADMQFSVV